ncbi:hypothetical protein Tco_0927241 [Tanacetum coccineum]
MISAGKKAASPSSVASERPASPNDYTPTDEVQTSRGDEGHLDLHGLTREVLKLKKHNAKQSWLNSLALTKCYRSCDSQMMNVDVYYTEVHEGLLKYMKSEDDAEQERGEQEITPSWKNPKKKKDSLLFKQLRAAETANGCIYRTGEWDYVYLGWAETKGITSRELMQRMLEHKLEVQRETEDALNLIRFVMKQKEDLEREEE